MFYEWRDALKLACKQKNLIDGQMVHHNRRLKQGCLRKWKKFTLKSRAEKHRNKAVTSKVRRRNLCVATLFDIGRAGGMGWGVVLSDVFKGICYEHLMFS